MSADGVPQAHCSTQGQYSNQYFCDLLQAYVLTYYNGICPHTYNGYKSLIAAEQYADASKPLPVFVDHYRCVALEGGSYA